jgi:hypothetical protein
MIVSWFNKRWKPRAPVNAYIQTIVLKWDYPILLECNLTTPYQITSLPLSIQVISVYSNKKGLTRKQFPIHPA